MSTNLSESRQAELRATNISMVILAVIFVVLRLIARIYTRVGLAIDDYTLLVALVSQYVALPDGSADQTPSSFCSQLSL